MSRRRNASPTSLLGALAKAAPDRIPAASSGDDEQRSLRRFGSARPRVRLLRDDRRRHGRFGARRRRERDPHAHDQQLEHALELWSTSIRCASRRYAIRRGSGGQRTPSRRRRASFARFEFLTAAKSRSSPTGASAALMVWRAEARASPAETRCCAAAAFTSCPLRESSKHCLATSCVSKLRVAAAGARSFLRRSSNLLSARKGNRFATTKFFGAARALSGEP